MPFQQAQEGILQNVVWFLAPCGRQAVSGFRTQGVGTAEL